MSDRYRYRLQTVLAEFDAAREALRYVSRNWQKQDVAAGIGNVTLHDLLQAGLRVEATYFIRLYAEFEGILKDHLATNHPLVRVPDRPKVDQLISLVVRAESLTLNPRLRDKLNAARDFRNSIAHSKRKAVPAVPFHGRPRLFGPVHSNAA